MFKFLVILVYYNRPKMVLNALLSVNGLNYPNYELAILDDGSDIPVEPIARKYLDEDVLKKTKFYQTGDTVEYKKSINGSRHGKFMTDIIRSSDCDYVMILCDDDALVYNSLWNLDTYFVNHEDELWTYGHVIIYDPETENAGLHLIKRDTNLNKIGDIWPSCEVDSSQVVYSIKLFNDAGLSYPEVGMGAMDSHIYTQLQSIIGKLCKFCGVDLQFKGIFANQMGERARRGKNIFETGDMP